MKRAWVLAPVLLLAISAQGQVIRGTSPSVTSMGRGWNVAPRGVPASVTSISPVPAGVGFQRGFVSPCTPGMLIPSAMGCTNPAFTPNLNQRFNNRGLDRRFGGRRGRGRGNRGFAPVVVPYAIPYATYSNYYPYGAQPGQTPPVQVDIVIEDRRNGEDGGRYRNDYGEYEYETEDGEILVRDDNGVRETNRARIRVRRSARQNDDPDRNVREAESRERIRRSRAAAPPEIEPTREPAPPREVTPAVLVFRDGSRHEVTNYAIVGKVLYDFQSMASRRIQLAELDLPATIRENDERGVDFAVPRGN